MKRIILPVILLCSLFTYGASDALAQIQVVAHRGYWNVNGNWSGNERTPQNSLASLAAADSIKADASEFDVNMTEDGGLLICHGPKVLSTPHVQKAPFDSTRNQRLSNGEKVPTLQEYLALGGRLKHTRLVLEIKAFYKDSAGYYPDLDLIIATVKKSKIKFEQLTIISFSLDICREAARHLPKTMVQYLGGDKTPKELHAQGIMGLDYHYSVFQKHPEWVEQAHELGMMVNVWTVDKKADIRQMIELGVDQITTNYPVLVQQMLRGELPKTVMIVGAHPDDPETGCGGTMIKMKEAGYDVVCLYLTKGEAGIEGKSADEAAAVRKAEAEQACKITGARPVFLSQTDGKCEINEERYREIYDVMRSIDPDIVFTHWPIDGHRDHRICSVLVYDTWRRMNRSFDLYYYEVMTGVQTQNFHPTHYVDITSVADKKHEACYKHESQNLKPVFEGWHYPMEIFRGIESRCKYAEAFVKQIEAEDITR